MAINPNNAVEMPAGFIRDGQTDTSILLVVNADGSINTKSGGSGTTADQVQGNAATGATPVGNPVQTGGVANAADPTRVEAKIAPFSFNLAGFLRSVLGAGEAHVGQVGGQNVTIPSAQTVTASSAYASGNCVGGLVTLAGASRVAGVGGLIQAATVNSKSAQTTQMDIVFFNANPTGSTITDKTAFAVAAADFDKVLGVMHVTDWTSLGTPSVGQAQQQAMPFALASGTTLYAALVTRSTPTFTSTSDISVGVRILQN